MSTQVNIAAAMAAVAPSAVQAPTETSWGSGLADRSGAPSHGGLRGRSRCRLVVRRRAASSPTLPWTHTAESAPRGTADDGRHPRLPGC